MVNEYKKRSFVNFLIKCLVKSKKIALLLNVPFKFGTISCNLKNRTYGHLNLLDKNMFVKLILWYKITEKYFIHIYCWRICNWCASKNVIFILFNFVCLLIDTVTIRYRKNIIICFPEN